MGNDKLERVVDLLYPRRCPVCDEPVPIGERLVCGKCREKIVYVTEPRCRRCGKQLNDATQIYCQDCETTPHLFNYGYALYDYQSMKHSIYKFKYHDRREYAKFYAQDIYENFGQEIDYMQADAIIPVPLHKSKLKKRGYNQAGLVARELSTLTGIPCLDGFVERIRETTPQKELDPYERQNNLKKAFNISLNDVKLNKTIVVDDIYTTGATIDAIAEVLRHHGVSYVYFITLCAGQGI